MAISQVGNIIQVNQVTSNIAEKMGKVQGREDMQNFAAAQESAEKNEKIQVVRPMEELDMVNTDDLEQDKHENAFDDDEEWEEDDSAEEEEEIDEIYLLDDKAQNTDTPPQIQIDIKV